MSDRRDLDEVKLIGGDARGSRDPLLDLDLKDSDLKDLDKDLLLGGPSDPLSAHDLLGDDLDEPKARRRKHKSSSGLLGTILFLLIVGGGGAFAYMNQAAILPVITPLINQYVPGLIPVATAPVQSPTPGVDAPLPDGNVAAVDPSLTAPLPVDSNAPLSVDGAVVPPPDSATAIADSVLADIPQPVDPVAAPAPAGASIAPLPTDSSVPAQSLPAGDTVAAVNPTSMTAAPAALTPPVVVPPVAATPPSATLPAVSDTDLKAPSSDTLVDPKTAKVPAPVATKPTPEVPKVDTPDKSAVHPDEMGEVAMPDLPSLEKAMGGKDDFIESTTVVEDLSEATQPRMNLNAEQKAMGLGITMGNSKPKPKANTDQPKAATITGTTGAVTTSNPESEIAAANRALELERYQAAFDMFSELYKNNARDERILMGRAVALQKLGRVDEAVRAYDELIAINPNNPDVMINALGLVRKNNPTEALSRLLTLRQKYPMNATIAAQVGLVNAELGNFEEGLRYLNIAADLESTNPKHYFNMAVIAERMKRSDLAVRYYEQALKADALTANPRNRLNREMLYDRLSVLRQGGQ